MYVTNIIIFQPPSLFFFSHAVLCKFAPLLLTFVFIPSFYITFLRYYSNSDCSRMFFLYISFILFLCLCFLFFFSHTLVYNFTLFLLYIFFLHLFTVLFHRESFFYCIIYFISLPSSAFSLFFFTLPFISFLFFLFTTFLFPPSCVKHIIPFLV